MTQYAEFHFTRDEIAVVREILNDSAVHFKHMAKEHVSLEHRVAERIGLDESTVSTIATQVWRMFDRAEEGSE